jgi:hypothetical protein
MEAHDAERHESGESGAGVAALRTEKGLQGQAGCEICLWTAPKNRPEARQSDDPSRAQPGATEALGGAV